MSQGQEKFGRGMRVGRFLLIGVGIFFGSLFMALLFEAELHEFFLILRLFGIVGFPVFFIIGVFLFLKDKWSVISTLSFMCLIVFLISGYSLFIRLFISTTSAINNSDGNVEPFLVRIFIAEFGIVLLVVARIIKYFWERKRFLEALNNSSPRKRPPASERYVSVGRNGKKIDYSTTREMMDTENKRKT